MFLVLLKFAEHKSKAGQFMDNHNEWIQRGLDDNVFLVIGSLKPAMGGAILADAVSLDELQLRVNQDPFVAEGVVSPEIIEFTPHTATETLQFLLA